MQKRTGQTNRPTASIAADRLHEFLKVTPQIREAIMHERNHNEIMSIAVQQGFHNLRYDGFKKALRGLTSLEDD